MKKYAGIDVSLEVSSVCVVDDKGQVLREAKVASDPESLIRWFAEHSLAHAEIGLEAGPLSQWLYAGLAAAGLTVTLLETRRVRDAVRTMPVKTDRKDARIIAELMRVGWAHPVHCKSLSSQEIRTLLAARKTLQSKRIDIELSLRGLLRGFGLKVGRTSPARFATRVRELTAGHAVLERVADALLAARAALDKEFRDLDRHVRQLARQHPHARLAMTAPGVGALVALSFVAGIDDPARFASSRDVGAHFGLTVRKYQSGERDINGRISKCGDRSVRTMLYEAAHVILTRPAVAKGTRLKAWGLGGPGGLQRRKGAGKAKIAVARKLAVILHRMLLDGTPFDARRLVA